MKTYFMRHGQTNYNVRSLCNENPGVDVHLTQTGRRQAQDAARRLAGTRIERVVVSPLPRTRQTADIVNQPHGAPVIVHPDIADFRTGLEGRPVAELMTLLSNDPMHGRAVPTGETRDEHRARVLRFLSWLHAQPAMTTLVVAHEETLRVVAAHFRELSDTDMLSLAFANCEILEFDLPRA